MTYSKDDFDGTLFDVESFLIDREIPYKTRGKNIKRGWIGIDCPWCMDDTTNHLGINLKSKNISCWRCPTKGTHIKLIMKIDGCSIGTAFKTSKKFTHSLSHVFEKTRSYAVVDSKESINKAIHFHELNINPGLNNFCRDFLIHRRYDPDEVTDKYHLYSGDLMGKFAYNLVVPFFLNQRLITFQYRKPVIKQKTSWISYSEEKSVLDPKRTLYNIDNAKEVVLITEGIFDVWRIGDGVVSTQGINYTSDQVILAYKFKRVFIGYDAEENAQVQAERLAHDISIINPNVFRLEISRGDLDNMSAEDAKVLRREVFQKIY